MMGKGSMSGKKAEKKDKKGKKEERVSHFLSPGQQGAFYFGSLTN
jgi:hypothetical protein